MAGNSEGPWGGQGDDGNRGSGDNIEGSERPRGPNKDRPQLSEIDDLVRKGQEQLRVLMGGRGGDRDGPGGGPGGPGVNRSTVGLAVLAGVAFWGFASFYTVRPEQ